jgi:hypothetical protein
MLDWWTVRQAGIYMLEKQKTFGINKNNWGLVNLTLQEINLS